MTDLRKNQTRIIKNQTPDIGPDEKPDPKDIKSQTQEKTGPGYQVSNIEQVLKKKITRLVVN